MLQGGYYMKLALLELQGKNINKTRELIKHYVGMTLFVGLIVLGLIYCV